jgi:SAM-dependent methyltransferase
MTEQEQYREFWNPKNDLEARRLILDSPNWDGPNECIGPCILTSYVQKNIPSWNTAVEIGAGVGRLVKHMRRRFENVIGVDISPGMVRLAKPYLMGTVNAEVRLCDGQSIPVDSDSADLVYSVICFQHIPWRETIQQYLKESLRVLRPGGLVRVQTHLGTGTGHFNAWVGHFYPTAEMFAQEFKDAGFNVVETNVGLAHPSYVWVTGVKR